MSHRFKAEKTYRYYTTGDDVSSKYLLIVLHGYGQLAKYFIKKFEKCSADYFVVAPEGPHRFYLQGYEGRVGASWMTKEARELDIEDNLNWLNGLLAELQKNKKYEKVILLGFSQGGPTAARWFFKNKSKFQKLILWSSVFPPDIDNKRISTTEGNVFVVGLNDEFINESLRNEEIKQYQSLGFETITFKGNHDINAQVLNDILA
jgi:predicted esterase